jgi:tetratricopeptide (TPR) repeat protein
MVRILLMLLPAIPLAAQTFARDIAPIIYQNCASCHRPGESAPFSLLNYEDVQKHARQIAAVTKSRYMPPWLPQPGYGEFQDEHRLTDAQIKLIGDWVEANMPQGNPSATPHPPEFTEGWQLGTPDLVLKASQPFHLAANGPDVFWNFVFTPAVPSTRYVRAIEIRPGDKRLVHHANVIVDRTNAARKMEKAPGLGFPGMDLDIKSNVFDPPGHFLFWKPGSAPYAEPDGFSWRLEPGNDLVLNAHLQPSGKPELVQPSIGLYFTDKPPTRFPVLIQLEHDGALNIPAATHDFLISDDFRIPVDLDVLAVYPHAHYLGKLLEAYATLPDGTRQWLIRIPNWDLNRQAVFHYRKPLFLPKGTLVSMRYHYDNSAANPRNPNQPPRRVKSGNNATDEMGHLWLQVLPRAPNDRRREVEEALMQHRVEKYPDDYVSYLDLGELKLSRLDTQGALSALETAVRLDPKQSQGHNILGAALTRVGQSRVAIEQFELALRLDPGNVNARYNLMFALIKAGNLTEAEGHLRQVIAVYPKDAGLHNLWGELLAREGKKSEAIAQFDEAISLDPTLEAARSNRQLVQSGVSQSTTGR